MKRTKKFSTLLNLTLTITVATITIWAVAISVTTTMWQKGLLALPAAITAWLCWTTHRHQCAYAERREIVFMALIPTGAFGLLETLALAFTGLSHSVPMYIATGFLVLSCSAILWKESVKDEPWKHGMYAIRILTIGWVAAWIYEGISTLCTVPEYITLLGKIYFALGIVYFLISFIELICPKLLKR